MAVVRLLFSSSSSLLLLSAPTLRHTFAFLQPHIRFDTFPQADSVLRLRCSHRLLLVDSGSNLELDPSLHESTSDQASLHRAPALIKDPDRNGRKTPATDYLGLSDEDLLAQCKMDTFRASGPGGQHRNKTNSAVRLRHTPTGLMSQAAEDRSQHRNRVFALRRLRQLISLKVRCPVNLENYSAPPELVRILPIPKRLQGNVQQIGPHHEDFSKGAQCLLDLIWEVEGSISSAAKLLSLSTGALNKVIASEKLVLQSINQLRVSKGMKPLH